MRLAALAGMLASLCASATGTNGITYDIRAFYVTVPFDVGKPQDVDINGDGIVDRTCNAYRRSLSEANATHESGLKLNDKGDVLHWDPADTLPNGVVCIASSDGVSNGSTVVITEPEPFQYLAERKDGCYDLRETETGTAISVQFWGNDISMIWIGSTLAHQREPLEGVALDVGPLSQSAFAKFAVTTPPNEWHDYMVFDPVTADGARILVLVRMHGSAEAIAEANASPTLEQYSFEFKISNVPSSLNEKLFATVAVDSEFKTQTGEAKRVIPLDETRPLYDQIALEPKRGRKTANVELISAPRVTLYSERTTKTMTSNRPWDADRPTPARKTILDPVLSELRPGMAVIADIMTQGKEWSGIACGVVANPGVSANTVSATIAPMLRTQVGLDNYVSYGFCADVQIILGKSAWFIFENKANPGTILVQVQADAVLPDVSPDFFLPTH